MLSLNLDFSCPPLNFHFDLKVRVFSALEFVVSLESSTLSHCFPRIRALNPFVEICCVKRPPPLRPSRFRERDR